jgi:hypothetical protein
MQAGKIDAACGARRISSISQAQFSRSVCVHEQHAARLRDSLAIGDQAVGDLLAVRDEFRAYGESVVHTGFAALLVDVVGLAGDGCESKTKQRQPERCADFHGSLLALRDANGIVLKSKRLAD